MKRSWLAPPALQEPKRTFSNLNILLQVYGPACVGMFVLPHATADGFFNEGFMNNTCIVSGSGMYFKVCQGGDGQWAGRAQCWRGETEMEGLQTADTLF